MTAVSNEEKILEMKEIQAGYGIAPVLMGISLNIKEREIVTLLGANGAGKTTTLNVIYGVIPVRRGELFLYGERVKSLPFHKLVELGVSYVPEGRKIFAPMSVMDNLILGAYHRWHRKEKRKDIDQDFASVFKLFPVLKGKRKQLAGTLSGGEQQMLALAKGLMSRPRLLLLDEPSLGLAPSLIVQVMQVINELRNQGLSVLLVEQNARAALSIADRGYIMETGRITIESTSDQLLSDEAVKAAYVGGKLR